MRNAEITRKAGWGPWTQIFDEMLRLRIGVWRGDCERVLRRVIELADKMKELPEPTPASPNDVVWTWNIRETMLNIGVGAAIKLNAWQAALDLNLQILQSKQARGAASLELAQDCLNNYSPLLNLQRYDEARDVLVFCKRTAEHENAIELLASVLGASGSLERQLGRATEALEFSASSLRLLYLSGSPEKIAVGHFNLANYIIDAKGQWSQALAHRIAATVLEAVIQSGGFDETLTALTRDVRAKRYHRSLSLADELPCAVCRGRKDRGRPFS